MFAITNTVKGWLVKGAFVALCAALAWQVWLIIDAKNERLKTQGDTIIRLTGENKKLRADAAAKARSDVVTETVKEAVKQEEAKPIQTKTLAEQYVENKLAQIEEKYAAKEKSAANEERKRTEISLERAKGLWLTYCLQAPQEAACK